MDAAEVTRRAEERFYGIYLDLLTFLTALHRGVARISKGGFPPWECPRTPTYAHAHCTNHPPIILNFRVMQNFAVFADRSASAISVVPRLPMRAGAAKTKTANISSGALRGDSAKVYGNSI